MKKAVQRSISFTDLQNAGYHIQLNEAGTGEDYRVKMAESQPPEIFKALKTLGLDVNEMITIQPECDHRTMGGKMTHNYRVTGRERVDKAWLRSGYASEEAQMADSRMGGMAAQCNRLSNGGDR